ncbi:conjugal transfer protein TraF [Pampinifervens florentissimum]|uniref:conjugal transfer protein TraF n=1 Tax=Pampinifervens florentissimum TaxID=1632019 RepID=UPI0013B49969|nr:conjugal transfer protein TraF [Hydrogenobacter sp. T-8]QID33089.1 conjugal transfer protein TraF [Hydrogenobacter sp. T-8]
MRKILLFIPLVVFAQEECKPLKEFYQDAERGWFWKEVCQKKEERKEVKKEEKQESVKLLKKKVVQIPWDKLDQMDPEEISKLEEESRKIAIMNPTEENVREWKRLVMWINDRAEKFAFVHYKVLKTEPGYMQKQNFTPARIAMAEYRNERKKEIFSKYRDRAGIIVFVEKGCPYCRAFSGTLRLFREKWGWDTKEVDIQERPDLASRFGTQLVPDIFLVLKRNGTFEWQRIGSGAMALDELEDSVIFGLYNLGEIKDERLISW